MPEQVRMGGRSTTGLPHSYVRIVRYHPRAVVGDGGMTNAIRRQSEAVVALGGSVTIAFDEGETPSKASGVDWVHVSHRGRAAVRLAVGLEEALSDADLLVLHSAWTPHNVRAARAARSAGVPYILEPRGAYDPHILARKALRKKVWWLAAERNLVNGSRAVHLFFDEERPHLRALGYEGAVIVASNGIDPPPDVRWDGGSGGYVLWLGRFDPEHKGLDLLVDAVGELAPDERPNLLLHGPDSRGGKRAVAELVRERGLAPWIQLGAPVYGQEKWNLLSRAAGFVYPSRWEGFGNSLAEAASIGLPSLVTPYPFGRSLASAGAAVLAPATPTGLAEGLRDRASKDGRKTGAIAAKVVRERYSWETVARLWLEQVKEIL